MELVTLTETLGDYFGTTQGLLVVRAPGDDRLGLRDGDVIIRIGDREPSGPGHAMRILRSYEPGEKVDIEIMRKKKRQSLSVEVPDRRMSLRAPLPPRPLRAPAAASAPAVARPPRPASGNTAT
jgi:S1-C subfamily serine protease